MGKINNELNHFFQDNSVFADVVNLCVYHGKKVVLSEELEEESQVLYPEDADGVKHELRSDVSKACRNGWKYQIFCLENECKISYVMPVRVMNYEAGRYMEQIRRISHRHEKKDYRNWAEFSSGFKKEDRLHPVITLVLYWQKDQWDGAIELCEMLDISKEEQALLEPFLQNYRLNLVNMHELEHLETCSSQLKYVLKLLQMDSDRDAMLEEVKRNEEYRELLPETGRVLSVLLGSRGLESVLEEQIKEGRRCDMCKALDDLWNDARKEGHTEGFSEGQMEGENIFARLTDCLLREHRLQELKMAVDSPETRRKLYAEYGIS